MFTGTFMVVPGRQTCAPRRLAPVLLVTTIAIQILAAGGSSVQGADAAMDRNALSGRVQSRRLLPETPPRATAPAAGQSIEIDARIVDFGEIELTQAATEARTLVIRVFSDRDWVLNVESTRGATSQILARSPWEWRVAGGKPFIPLKSGQRSRVAQGKATPSGGVVVFVEVRLALRDDDHEGRYEDDLDFILDSPM